MDKKNKITKTTHDELVKELDNLLHVERVNVIKEISEAREQGDLSENAEFDAAREKQAHLESRIKEIQNIVDNSQIIKKTKSKKIVLGSKVEFKNIKTNVVSNVEIIGTIGVDPFANPMKISSDSPVGVALLTKKVKDVVTIKTNNEYKVEIIKIS